MQEKICEIFLRHVKAKRKCRFLNHLRDLRSVLANVLYFDMFLLGSYDPSNGKEIGEAAGQHFRIERGDVESFVGSSAAVG